MEKAIKKAIEGGYKNPLMYSGNLYDSKLEIVAFNGKYTISIREITLDPLFWSSLGKALGWETKMVVRRGIVIGNFMMKNPDNSIRFYGEEMGADMDYLNPEIYYALKFHEKNLTQGWDSAVKWLETLLDNDMGK